LILVLEIPARTEQTLEQTTQLTVVVSA